MAKTYHRETGHVRGVKKRTSIGRNSSRSKPKNKHKKRNFKKYRGQGK